MKRLLVVFFVLILFSTAISPSLAEDNSSVCSYDFDLRFHMNADIFRVRERDHMQGYADLLNMLELKGNLTYSPVTKAIDLNAEIIPVTNPEASVSFRLYGVPDNMGLSSPLLGDETIWFQNPFLMEFAFKTWNNLQFPLQYLALLYPYVTETAFLRLADAWNVRFGAVHESASFSREDLTSLSESWSAVLHEDTQLKYWIYSLSLPVKQGDIMETEFYRLPDYLLNRVFPEGGMHYVADGETEIWTNEQGVPLFTRITGNGSSEWTLSLPETESGYLPRLSVRSVTDSNSRYSLALEGSYNLPETRSSVHAALPESLIAVSLNMNNWPAAWPMDADFDATLTVGGILYPNNVMAVRGTSTADGNISLTLSVQVEEDGPLSDVFSCTGTVVPAVPSGVPGYTRDDFVSFLSIFNVSDSSKDDFIHRVRRPLFLGILNFLNELPAGACQSVMDDLEDYGVLDMVLID